MQKAYLFLHKDGEMGELMHSFDWSRTAVGEPGNWPQSLRTLVSTLLHSKFPMLLWWGQDLIQFYNDAFRPSLGNTGKHPLALGQKGAECWPETWPIIYPLVEQVQLTGQAVWMEDQLVPIYRNGKIEPVYWTYSYSPVFGDNDQPAGILITCTETTGKVNNLKQLEEKEEQLRFALEAAELATWDYDPLTNRFTGNSRLKDWFGLLPEQEIDLSLALNAIAEKDRQRVEGAIRQALKGESGGYYDIEYEIVHRVTFQTKIIRAKGRVWFTEKKEAYRFNGTLQDVTEQTRIRKEVEQRETNLRNIVLQAPVAMCILQGPQYTIEIANRRMFELWGGSGEQSFLHQPMFEALPEVANQGYEILLAGVFESGQGFSANEMPVTLPREGRLETVFISLVLEPIRGINGSVAGILGMATDITDQVRARKKVEEAEERMRLSLEAADLGSFEVNLVTKEVSTSNRFDAIFGTDHSKEHGYYIHSIHPDDRPLREQAYQQAFKTGLLTYEARMVWKDGSVHWIRVWGNIYFDETSKPVKLQGVVQDITAQKEFAEELGRQVRERTLALESKNKELERSNANLEEFAHAASHDLKEPIRKIHYFTSRLKDRLSNRLNEEESALFAPIERAMERMSELIDDLLLYSHVSQRPHKKESVDLNVKLQRVLEDLEVDIQEKGAVIQASTLPVINGYRRQLQQLFHNLITNAIKYSKAGITPQIVISSSTVSAAEAGLAGTDTYHLIEFSDNGIGFEQEYAEKIFHMFTRLHGKNEYSGTGVGLSIAKKVVENHSGYISAEGLPGTGSVFKIYLPVEG